MTVELTYLNEHIELFDGVYDADRAGEIRGAVRLYNRVIGPVTSLNLVRPEPADLSMYSAYCHHSPIEWLVRDLQVKEKPGSAHIPGGGKGATLLRPVLGALGEMAERLLAVLHFMSLAERIHYGSHTDLTRAGLLALAPAAIPTFAEEQRAAPGFRFERYEPDTYLGWVEGVQLLTGRPIWVPAQLVLMYYRPRPGEPMIGYATTAGLASHTSARSSVLHGLFEVIERDALNLCWYSRLAPPRVNVELDAVLAQRLGVPRSRMSTPHVDVSVFDLTLDSPNPVLATIGFDRSRSERAFLGGTGGAAQPAEALGQALFELGQCQTGFHFEDPFGRSPIHADTELVDVIEFFDAPLYYGHSVNLPRTYWFTESPHTVEWSDLPSIEDSDEARTFERMLDWLRERRFEPIVLDFGDACPPGVHVTKIYVPELTQACPPRYPMLGHPRFYELPQTLGRAERRLDFADLNPDPIPFA